MSGPASIEYDAIRLARKPADDGTLRFIVSVPGANGALDLDLGQLNDLLDGAATMLRRPDIIAQHHWRPRRNDPGRAPRPAQKEEHRNYDH